jgi:hypothetical protein
MMESGIRKTFELWEIYIPVSVVVNSAHHSKQPLVGYFELLVWVVQSPCAHDIVKIRFVQLVAWFASSAPLCEQISKAVILDTNNKFGKVHKASQLHKSTLLPGCNTHGDICIKGKHQRGTYEACGRILQLSVVKLVQQTHL